MAVEIFRRGMNDDIGAMRERAAIDRARERRIDHDRDAPLLGEDRQLRNVDHAARRIDRRLHEDHARVLPNRVAPYPPLIRIGEAHLDSHRDELFGEELSRSAVDPRAREQVIARAKKSEQRARSRSHSARQDQGRFGAFEQRDALLHYLFVRRVAVARVHQRFRACGAEFLYVVDGLRERRRDR